MRARSDGSGGRQMLQSRGNLSGSFMPRTAWVWGWLILCLAVAKTAQAGDAWHFRTGGQITANLAENVKATMSTQSRYDDGGSFYYQYSDIGLAYTGLVPWLDVSANYKVIFTQQTNDTWTYGTLPNLNATVRFPVLGITFSDRLRLEYTNPQNLSDFGTVRNKLSVNPPIYLDPIRERAREHHYKLRPFLGYEFFYNTDSGIIYRQEFSGGLSMSFTERVIGDLYYIRQENVLDSDSDFSEGYTGLNIAGFTLRLLF